MNRDSPNHREEGLAEGGLYLGVSHSIEVGNLLEGDKIRVSTS
jgi:hypothetical protein